MALSKRISNGNGVTINYHRIAEVRTITNIATDISVISYTSRAKRTEEQAALAAGEPMNVYMDCYVYSAPYDQSMTVDDAYEWIKANVPEFDGAGDVLEDDEVAS